MYFKSQLGFASLCFQQIVALANLLPVDDSVDELDSYMYQTVRVCLLPLLSLMVSIYIYMLMIVR